MCISYRKYNSKSCLLSYMDVLKIGIIGLNIQESSFFKHSHQSESYLIEGCFDLNTKPSDNTFKRYSSSTELIQAADFVVLYCPPELNYSFAEKVLKNSTHLLIENFAGTDLTEARQIVELAHEAGVKVFFSNPLQTLTDIRHIQSQNFNPEIIEIKDIYSLKEGENSQSLIRERLTLNTSVLLALTDSNIKQIYVNHTSLLGVVPDTFQIFFELDNSRAASFFIHPTDEQNKSVHSVHLMKNRNQITADLKHHKIREVIYPELGSTPQIKNYSSQNLYSESTLLNYFIQIIRQKKADKYHPEHELKILEITNRILNKVNRWATVIS